jgi:hypothetical protein
MADLKPPRLASGEADTLRALLQYQRESLLRKVDGVDEDRARWSPVGSGTSLLWLVTHMAAAEVTWVLHRFAGQDPDPAAAAPPGGTLRDAAEAYRRGWPRVDAVAFDGTGLDEVCRRPDPGPPASLRWVLMHLLEETARHAGHADILRELIDGSTGRLAANPPNRANRPKGCRTATRVTAWTRANPSSGRHPVCGPRHRRDRARARRHRHDVQPWPVEPRAVSRRGDGHRRPDRGPVAA